VKEAPLTKISIRNQGNEFPYNNCIVEEGSVENMETEPLVFRTTSKAGIERRVRIFPNGNVVDEIISEPAE